MVAVLGGGGERVSAVQFPDFRENTGNFRRFSPPDGEALQLSNILSQLVTAKFPAQRNRELSQTNRELASSYQGRQEGERSLLPERTPTSLSEQKSEEGRHQFRS
jgi:hypothetical protein